METQGPEPTGWELMRGLDAVRDEVRNIGGKVVSQAAYDSDKIGIDTRFKRIENEVDAFHTIAKERDNKEQAQRQENDRFRKNMNLSLTLAVASPVIAIIVAVLFRMGGIG